MVIEIAGLMTGMIMMLARLFLLAGLIAVAVVIKVARLMAGVIMMFAGVFRCHVGSPLRVINFKQRIVTLVPSATNIPNTRRNVDLNL